MKSLKSIVVALFTLVVMFAAPTYAAEGSSQVNSDVEAIQSEIQNAQRAFTQLRKSKGKNIQQFDTAIKRIRIQINSLNVTLKSPKQGSVASSKDLGDSASRLNAYFRSLEKARAQSDWRAVERDLGRLDSSAKELHSAALKVPGTPGSVSRKPPKPPATGPSGTPSVAGTPKPRPDSKPRTVDPYKPPLPVTRGPGPKGPDDPRFAVPPAPPVPPEDPPEPPPPDDGRGGKVMPMPMEESAGQGSPPMMRKPARRPEKIAESVPNPKPIPLRSGLTVHFASDRRLARETGSAQPPAMSPEALSRPLSRVDITTALESVRRAFNIPPRSGGNSESTPFIEMSPMQMRGIRSGSLSDYDWYSVHHGDHIPWAVSALDPPITLFRRDYVYCDDNWSMLVFSLHQLDERNVYLADLTVEFMGATDWAINNEPVTSNSGHILYAFTKDRLESGYLLKLRCTDANHSWGIFKKIDVYNVY